MPSPLSISHRPYGLDGPYDTQPDERFPRDPAGGDMVAIGFLTSPGRAAEHVALHWARNGRPQAPILARPVSRGTDADRWLVELGVIEAGDSVEYWIMASDGAQNSQTERYSFVARRWRRLAAISAAAPLDDGLRLATRGDDGAPGPALTIRSAGLHGTLRLHIGDRPGIADGTTYQDQTTHRVVSTSGIADGTTYQDQTTHRVVSTVKGDGIALAIDPASGRLTFGAPGDDARQATLTMRWLEEGDGALAAVELLGALGDDEALVGFGERFDALDQRGRAPDVAVYEQYKNQGNRTYLPVPFFMSSRGYGCLVAGSGHVAYDLGRAAHDRWRCVASVPSTAGLALDLFAGQPVAMLRAFGELTERPELPPSWVFGPWMSSNEWNTQARVEAEVAQTQEHGIPATVLVIEAWSDETTFYIWNGAEYRAGEGAGALKLVDFRFPSDGPWPDPKAMTDALHDSGIRLLLWQIPALKKIDGPHPQHDADVDHALEHGYALRDGAGQPYRNPGFWFNDALIPDFTSPAASAWWLSKRAYLLDEMGIDGFKTDGGEHLQGRGIQASDGRRGDELVNAFPNLYIGAYYRFARERRGGDAITFSRAGHTGAGALPTHWAGDENSTWEAFRRSIVAGLSAGLSGVAFWGWDIAGFSDALPSAELYLRAAAMAAFCPIMQYHSEYTPPGAPSKDRTPWRIQQHSGDDRVIPLYRHFARLRMNLLPYILGEAAHCAATGEPLLRPLLLDDPDDREAWRIQDQYRFGRDLLVAPVVEEGATARMLYLPRGTWHDLWGDAALEGGRWIEVDVPLDRIPVYVRAGALLPLNLGVANALGDDVGNATDRYERLNFWLYPEQRTLYGGLSVAAHQAASYEWVDAMGVRRHFVTEQLPDGTIQADLPPLPFACRLAIPGGASVEVKASEQTRRVRLEQRTQ